MSPPETRQTNDTALALSLLSLGIVGLTLGYAPWLPAALVLAAIVVLIAGAVHVKPGLLARRAAGIFILALIPAGLQANVNYRTFLHAYNPHHAILPLNHAWHPAALQHYPALLTSLTIAGAALISAMILTYWHVRQRRSPTLGHWAQIGDHSGQHPLSRRQER